MSGPCSGSNVAAPWLLHLLTCYSPSRPARERPSPVLPGAMEKAGGESGVVARRRALRPSFAVQVREGAGGRAGGKGVGGWGSAVLPHVFRA